MPGLSHISILGHVAHDAHGCPSCPHTCVGPAITGSPDVLVNRRPVLRVNDRGIHAGCCGPNTWEAAKGSSTVFVNGRAAVRQGDETRHCGGVGSVQGGSPNVNAGG